MMQDNEKKAVAAVVAELRRARSLFPAMHSAHEGAAVIREEYDELWEEVCRGGDQVRRTEKMRKEAIQLAAMALRFVLDVCDTPSADVGTRATRIAPEPTKGKIVVSKEPPIEGETPAWVTADDVRSYVHLNTGSKRRWHVLRYPGPSPQARTFCGVRLPGRVDGPDMTTGMSVDEAKRLGEGVCKLCLREHEKSSNARKTIVEAAQAKKGE